MEMTMTDDEVRRLANKIAEILYPQLEEAIKGKAKWTVRELNKLHGEYKSVKDLAVQFNITEQHIRNLITRGMPHVYLGTSVRVETSILEHAILEEERIG
jgi:hypothetical protein